MHGFTQGVITGISGGDFYQGFWSAAVSSVVSSAVQLSGPSFLGGGEWDFYASKDFQTVLFGTVSGGLSAELTGGNFWQGAATGLTVSGLNHVAHRENAPDNGYERDGNGGYRKINNNGGDETDYLYENGQIVESRKVVQTAHEMERRTYGIKPPDSYNLIDPTGDIVYGIFGGGLELKAGWGLLKFGTTRVLKSAVGERVALGASKFTLKSSVYFKGLLNGNHSINIFGIKSLPTLYGSASGWATFFGRNTPVLGGIIMFDGGRRMYNSVFK